MGKFIITEEEKNRILGMHKSRSAKNYLMEGASPYSQLDGMTFKVVSVDASKAPENKKQVIQNINEVVVDGPGYGRWPIQVSYEDPNKLEFALNGSNMYFDATYDFTQKTISAKIPDDNTGSVVIFNIPDLVNKIEEVKEVK